jgi:hypothetical protein
MIKSTLIFIAIMYFGTWLLMLMLILFTYIRQSIKRKYKGLKGV